ncbi:MAG: ATP-dependent DNA helicase RecG [Acidobacteriia bacterium]|nr:ATP-dependent DNA helicase RecG [Terriglobia bacterium]
MVFPREQRAHHRQHQPQQQRPAVRTRQSVIGHKNPPRRARRRQPTLAIRSRAAQVSLAPAAPQRGFRPRQWYKCRAMPLPLTTEVRMLKGVGPQRAEMLAKRGIRTFEDLLAYLPFRYEDRIHFSTIREIQPGGTYTIRARVASGGAVQSLRGFHKADAVYHLLVQDDTGSLPCKFFHGGYLEGRLKPGQLVILHGKAEIDRLRPARIEMVNPQMELLSGEGEDSTEVGRIVPIYEAIGTFGSRGIRRAMYMALQQLAADFPDPLPAPLRQRLGYPPRREAFIAAHFPPATESIDALNAFSSPAQRRLIFDEFFLYQLSLALDRRATRRQNAIAFAVREERVREALKRILPFKPTAAQKRVLAEIAADLEKPAPMNRLLQGDVGSGKTIVALEAAVIAIENGCQAALMAPTEILAVQHFLSARRILARAGYRVELLISGLKPKEKAAARERIRSGEAQLVIGTHALIEEDAEFARLGLACIDEQHRFGVLQRKRLMDKAASHGHAPHVLVLTATPIPRTLSLTLYGDLDVSLLDELPPGRTPIETRLTSEPHLPGVWEFLRGEIARGRQAFVVYPVIEESKLELKAAIAEYARLSKEVFPTLRLGLLHGRLSSEEKDGVMQRFRANELQILVATTVVEVGVDVPNASVMVIEHAERFGLSQLHQLRGRIGRGGEKSFCILVGPQRMSDEARLRLETLVRTTNGFEIAETDLQLRGPGEFFGTRQHGDLGFHIANPLRDRELLELARGEAFALVEDHAQAAALQSVLRVLPPHWHQRYHLARIG